MANILSIVPHLRFQGSTTQLLQLAMGLSPAHRLRVAALVAFGPAAPRLQAAGREVVGLSASRRPSLALLVNLRQQLRSGKPDVLHVWGLPALRAVYLANGWPRCPVVLSRPFAADRGARGPQFVDRWLLRRCQAIVVADAAEADRCRQAGITAPKVVVVPPGVGDDGAANTTTQSSEPIILCVGPVERHKGFYEAIWAYDALRHLRREVRLWIVGAGADLPRLRRFTQAIDLDPYVTFFGTQPELRPYLQRAMAVWVPSYVPAGRQVVVEAMAAGKPVIASDLPGLKDLIADGETGFHVPPGRKVDFARRTRLLVDQPDLAHALADAGRRHAATRYHSRHVVEQFSDLYARLAG